MTILLQALLRTQAQAAPPRVIGSQALVVYLLKMEQQDIARECEHFLNPLVDIMVASVAWLKDNPKPETVAALSRLLCKL